jgi:hypothetical protein
MAKGGLRRKLARAGRRILGKKGFSKARKFGRKAGRIAKAAGGAALNTIPAYSIGKAVYKAARK